MHICDIKLPKVQRRQTSRSFKKACDDVCSYFSLADPNVGLRL